MKFLATHRSVHTAQDENRFRFQTCSSKNWLATAKGTRFRFFSRRTTFLHLLQLYPFDTRAIATQQQQQQIILTHFPPKCPLPSRGVAHRQPNLMCAPSANYSLLLPARHHLTHSSSQSCRRGPLRPTSRAIKRPRHKRKLQTSPEYLHTFSLCHATRRTLDSSSYRSLTHHILTNIPLQHIASSMPSLFPAPPANEIVFIGSPFCAYVSLYPTLPFTKETNGYHHEYLYLVVKKCVRAKGRRSLLRAAQLEVRSLSTRSLFFYNVRKQHHHRRELSLVS